MPAGSKQDVNAEIYNYEIAYKSSVYLFPKSNNRLDLCRYWSPKLMWLDEFIQAGDCELSLGYLDL